MVKEKYVRVCPICGSENYNNFKEVLTSEIAGQEMYKCKVCKNVFSFPIELPKSQIKKLNPKKISKLISKDTPKETYYTLGKFEVGIYWKILTFILLILSISFIYYSTVPEFCSENSLGEIECVKNSDPNGFFFLGIITFIGSVYLFFESFVLFKMKEKQSFFVRIILLFLLILIAYFYGYPMIFFTP